MIFILYLAESMDGHRRKLPRLSFYNQDHTVKIILKVSDSFSQAVVFIWGYDEIFVKR